MIWIMIRFELFIFAERILFDIRKICPGFFKYYLRSIDEAKTIFMQMASGEAFMFKNKILDKKREAIEYSYPF